MWRDWKISGIKKTWKNTYHDAETMFYPRQKSNVYNFGLCSSTEIAINQHTVPSNRPTEIIGSVIWLSLL